MKRSDRHILIFIMVVFSLSVVYQFEANDWFWMIWLMFCFLALFSKYEHSGSKKERFLTNFLFSNKILFLLFCLLIFLALASVIASLLLFFFMYILLNGISNASDFLFGWNFDVNFLFKWIESNAISLAAFLGVICWSFYDPLRTWIKSALEEM